MLIVVAIMLFLVHILSFIIFIYWNLSQFHITYSLLRALAVAELGGRRHPAVRPVPAWRRVMKYRGLRAKLNATLVIRSKTD